MKILISACLLGANCRYDGKSSCAIPEIEYLKSKYTLIPVCPETAGGLGTPRISSEKSGERVFNKVGTDVTSNFKKGAEEALRLCRMHDCTIAVLKERSPSCGFGKIYDGSFTGNIISGNGITAECLSKNGIKIIGESKISEEL